MKSASIFIIKLYRLFNESCIIKNNWSHIYNWINDETIAILNPNLFLNICCKNIFRFTKINSFYRQLNLYGFIRVSNNNNNKIYKNKLFLKNMNYSDLKNIKRTNIKIINITNQYKLINNNEKIVAVETIHDVTNQDETIQNETIQNETIQNETIQNETIQNETIQNEKLNCGNNNSYLNSNIMSQDYLNSTIKFKSYFDYFDILIDNIFNDSKIDIYPNQIDRISINSLDHLYENEY